MLHVLKETEITMKKPTIKEIAHIVGVSTTTISRYLNDKFDNMSDETKNRIQEVILELNYRPSSIARTLKTNKSGMIGLIISDMTKPFASILCKAVNDVCVEEDFQLMIANSDNDKSNERKHLKAMTEYNFEGIMINHTGTNLDYLFDLKNEGAKLVFVNQGTDNRNIDSVTTNNREVTQRVIRSLFEKGYEDIYFVSNETTGDSVRNEIHWGFRLACQGYLNDCDSRFIYLNNSNIEEKFKCIIENYKKRNTAVFCENGILLLQTVRYFNRNNLRIPDDIGVVGVDDLEWSGTLEEDISVIKQPIYKVGREAAKLLIGKINGERNVNEAMHLILKNNYIERDSTRLVK
jgi:LacI family transcriptional regulator, kdg operon repressor